MVNGSSRKLISVFTILTAIISIIVNNGVAQVVVIAIVLTMFKNIGDPEPGTSRFCKGIMLAACVGSQTGGLALPCSNAVNAVVMELAESIGGVSNMTFLQWAIYGVPASIIITAFAAWFIPFIVKPEELTKEQFESMERIFDGIPETLQANDWKFLIIMLAMIVCWISGTWVSIFDIATVAMAGVFIMMLPGVELLTVKDYTKNFSANQIVVLLCLFPMASAMASSGAGEWLVNNIFSGATNWSTWVFYVVAALTAFVVHLLVPSGSANASLSALSIGPLAVACGIPAPAVLFVVALQAGSSYILPVDGIWGYTFGYGYYKFSDPMRMLWPLVSFILIFAVTVVPLLTALYTSIGLVA